MSLALFETVNLAALPGDFDPLKVFAISRTIVTKAGTLQEESKEVPNKIGAFEVAYIGIQLQSVLERSFSPELEARATDVVRMKYVDCVASEPVQDIVRAFGTGAIGMAVPLSWIVAIMNEQRPGGIMNQLKLDGSMNVFLSLDDKDEPFWVHVSLKENRWYVGATPLVALHKNEVRRFFGHRPK